jgi:hypothetical protein
MLKQEIIDRFDNIIFFFATAAQCGDISSQAREREREDKCTRDSATA